MCAEICQLGNEVVDAWVGHWFREELVPVDVDGFFVSFRLLFLYSFGFWLFLVFDFRVCFRPGLWMGYWLWRVLFLVGSCGLLQDLKVVHGFVEVEQFVERVLNRFGLSGSFWWCVCGGLGGCSG